MRGGRADDGGHGMADIPGKHRLKLGGAADDRDNRQRPDQAGKAVDKGIFAPENNRRPQDHRLGKGRAHSGFAFALGPAIGRSAVGIGANGRHMNKCFDAGLCRGLRNMAGPGDMNLVHIGKAAHQIDHRIGPINGRGQRVGPRNICRDIGDLAQIRLRLQIIGIFGAAFGHADAGTAAQQGLNHIAAHKTATAKNRH